MFDEKKNNDIVKSIAPTAWLNKSTLLLSDGKQVVIDPNEVNSIWKNKGKNVVVFENVHPDPDIRKSFLTGASIEIQPNDYAFLPHKYWIAWDGYIGNKSGEDIHGEFFHGETIREIKKQLLENKNK